MIQLIGPGGAGKTTIGMALARRLGARFVDLDAEFTFRNGDIGAYIDAHGYRAYATLNVGLFLELSGGEDRHEVVALSSGFMTYASDVHPAYLACRNRMASSPSTFVLIPSLHLEACVNETVRRQLTRPFARSAEREEQVIRSRFPMYTDLPGRKIETMQSVDTAVTELLSALAARDAAAPDEGAANAARR